MAFLNKIIKISVLVLILAFAVSWFSCGCTEKKNKEVVDWARENQIKIDKSVKERQFKIEYNENEWVDLVRRLNNTRYFDSLDQSEPFAFDFGFNVEYAKELATYWATKYNWKKQVDDLNRFSHYLIEFEGIKLHYFRSNDNKHENSKKIPIMLLNGWPSTFYEFYKAVDYINKNLNNAERHFDIIVPSIPGFGYSIPLTKKIDIIGTARVYDALMRYLFHANCRYYVLGEDWGAAIAKMMTLMYPSRVAGLHLTMTSPSDAFKGMRLVKSILASVFPSFMLTQEEQESNFQFCVLDRLKFIIKGSGYFHIQATKPDTLAFGFTDSPVGLMTYILEKFAYGTFRYLTDVVQQKDCGLEKLSKDELLTTVTLYWMTNTISSSMRYYKTNMDTIVAGEHFTKLLTSIPTPKEVPVAILSLQGEIDHTPLVVLKDIYSNLTKYTIRKAGSHFASFIDPELSSKHLISFIDSVSK